MRRSQLEQRRLGRDDDPPLLMLDRDDFLGRKQCVPAIPCLHSKRTRLVRLPDPDLLDPADVALGRLDEETVRVAELLIRFGKCSHLCAEIRLVVLAHPGHISCSATSVCSNGLLQEVLEPCPQPLDVCMSYLPGRSCLLLVLYPVNLPVSKPRVTVAMITPPSTTEARRKPVSKKRSTRSAKWRSVPPLTKLPLVEPPDVKYARSGDVSIAYQVVGSGHVDLVFVPFLLSMIFAWLHPLYVGFFERLASFSRLILFDKRGTGASDRPRGLPTLESQMDDVRAVLDAVGSERAALFGAGHGALMCALFAATYPERTSQLVTWTVFPRLPGSTEEHRELIKQAREEWGQSDSFDKIIREQYPSLADDQSFRRVLPTIIRASASPGAAAEFNRTLVEADISEVLPAIRVPTLLLYPRMMGATPYLLLLRDLEEQTEQVALAIPDARVVGIRGPDPNPFVAEEVTTEVRRFLTERDAEPVPDRVLATVLFTDIVGSTARASALGDQAWRKEIDTAGDGFFATFDGPARGIACAGAIMSASAEQGIDVRLGLHTGECERDGAKVTGIAVPIGSRVASLAGAGEILVSRTVKDLVAGSGIEFQDRGEHELKGVPGEW